MVKILKDRWLAGLVVIFAGFTIVFGASIFVRFIGDGLLEVVLFGLAPIVSAAVLLVGFFISERAPKKGAALLTIGAVTIPAIHFWMFPIYVPITLAIIGFGVYRARRFARKRDWIATARPRSRWWLARSSEYCLTLPGACRQACPRALTGVLE